MALKKLQRQPVTGRRWRQCEIKVRFFFRGSGGSRLRPPFTCFDNWLSLIGTYPQRHSTYSCQKHLPVKIFIRGFLMISTRSSTIISPLNLIFGLPWLIRRWLPSPSFWIHCASHGSASFLMIWRDIDSQSQPCQIRSRCCMVAFFFSLPSFFLFLSDSKFP